MLEAESGGLETCGFASPQSAGECSCFYLFFSFFFVVFSFPLMNRVDRNIAARGCTAVITDFFGITFP